MKKIALVTGMDVSNIAKSVCKKFTIEGYDVVLTHAVNYDYDINQLEKEIGSNSRLYFEEIDFYTKDGIEKGIANLTKYKFDTIVNCAAILATDDSGLKHEFYSYDYDEFSKVLSYNVAAIAAICIGLKDYINVGGSIINVTSSAAEEGGFATISYNASKAAIKNLTKSLANNFGRYNGVRVNSVAPGWIPQSDDVAQDSVVALAYALTPLANRGKPEDMANTVYHVANCCFETGANYAVDGGITSSYLPYMLESFEMQGISTNDTIQKIVKLLNDLNEKK